MLTDNMYVDYVANFKHLFMRSHITKWIEWVLLHCCRLYTEVVKCLGKKHTSAYVQLCSSIQPATSTMLWPPHFYAPLCREPQRPFPLFPFFRLFQLTQHICFHSRNLLFRKFRKRKQTVKLQTCKLLYLAVQWLSLLQKQ